MNVEELIEVLRKEDPKAVVVTNVATGFVEEAEDLEILEVQRGWWGLSVGSFPYPMFSTNPTDSSVKPMKAVLL